jgi:hypothetical protein
VIRRRKTMVLSSQAVLTGAFAGAGCAWARGLPASVAIQKMSPTRVLKDMNTPQASGNFKYSIIIQF